MASSGKMGKTIRGEARNIIAHVMYECDQEKAAKGLTFSVNRSNDRVAQYCGISIRTVYNIRNELKSSDSGLLETPGKTRPRSSPLCTDSIESFDHRAIRNTVVRHQRPEAAGTKGRKAVAAEVPNSEASFIPGKRGKQMLLFERFKFCESGTLASDETKWRCSIKSCAAWVKTWGRTARITECNLMHNHEPLTAKEELKQQIAGAAKRIALDEPGERPSRIFEGLIDSESANKLTPGDVRNVKQAMYRERRKKFNVLPSPRKKLRKASEEMEDLHTIGEELYLQDSNGQEEGYYEQEESVVLDEEYIKIKLEPNGLSDFQEENTNDTSFSGIPHVNHSQNSSAGSPRINTVANHLVSFESQRGDARDEFTVYGELVAMKLRKLSSPQSRYLVQCAINKILFQPEIGMFESLHNSKPQAKHPQRPHNSSEPTSASNSGIPMATSEPSESLSFVCTTEYAPSPSDHSSPPSPNYTKSSPPEGDSQSQQFKAEPIEETQPQKSPSPLPISSSMDSLIHIREEQYLKDSNDQKEEFYEQEESVELDEEDLKLKLEPNEHSDFQKENTNDTSFSGIPHVHHSRNSSAGLPIINTVANHLVSFESQRADARDEFTVYGELVAMKLRKLSSPQSRYLAQSAINKILFQPEIVMFESLHNSKPQAKHPQRPHNSSQPTSASNSGIPMATCEPSESPSFVCTTEYAPSPSDHSSSPSPNYPKSSPPEGDSQSQRFKAEPIEETQPQTSPSPLPISSGIDSLIP